MRVFGLLVVGLACSMLFSPSFVEGQNSKSQQPSSTFGEPPLLRRVVVKHHGFGDAALNDTVMNEQEEYVKKHLEDRPVVETAFDPKKAEEMKKVLEGFWKERGVPVEVYAILKPVPHSHGYAVLEFDVYKNKKSDNPPYRTGFLSD